MPSRWNDLDRPPLHGTDLTRSLLREGLLPTDVRVRVVTQTASTMADVRQAALAGAPEGEILLAEVQTAGRGRHGRTWTAPPCAALTFSVLLRPDSVPPVRWTWLPLLAGVAAASALRRIGEVEVGVKWPNDLLIKERKLGGILVERVEESGTLPPAAVVGIGLNVSLRADELPQPTATSLLLAEAACTDRAPVFRAVLRELFTRYVAWRDASGDPEASGLRQAYREVSATLDRPVRVELPGGELLRGTARDLDDTGALVVEPEGGGPRRALSAGEVTHVRHDDAA